MNFAVKIILTGGEAFVINKLDDLALYLKNKFVEQYGLNKIDTIEIEVDDEGANAYDVKEDLKGFLSDVWLLVTEMIGDTSETPQPELQAAFKEVINDIVLKIKTLSKGGISLRKLSFYYMQGLKIYQKALKLIESLKREQGITEGTKDPKSLEDIYKYMKNLLGFIKVTKKILGKYNDEQSQTIPYNQEVVEFIIKALKEEEVSEQIITSPNWKNNPATFYYFFKKLANWIGALLNEYEESPQEFQIATPEDLMAAEAEDEENFDRFIDMLRAEMADSPSDSEPGAVTEADADLSANELRGILLRKLEDFRARSSKNPETGDIELRRKDFLSFAADIPNEQIKNLFKDVKDWPTLWQAFKSVEKVLKKMSKQEPSADAAVQEKANQFLRGLYKQTSELWSRYLKALEGKYPDKTIPSDEEGQQLKKIGKFSQSFAHFLHAQITAQQKKQNPLYTSTYPKISRKLDPDKIVDLETSPDQWESIIQNYFSEKYIDPIEAMIKKLGGSLERSDVNVDEVMSAYGNPPRKIVIAEKAGKKYGFYKSTSRETWLPFGGVVVYAARGQPFWMLKISNEEEGSDQTGKGVDSDSTLGKIASDLGDLDSINEALLNEAQLTIEHTARYLGKFFNESPAVMERALEGAIKINRAFQEAGVLKKDWAKSHKVLLGREDEKSFWGIDDINLAGMYFINKGKMPDDLPMINKDGVFVERPIALLSEKELEIKMTKFAEMYRDMQSFERHDSVAPESRDKFRADKKRIKEKFLKYRNELRKRLKKNESRIHQNKITARLLKAVVTKEIRKLYGQKKLRY